MQPYLSKQKPSKKSICTYQLYYADEQRKFIKKPGIAIDCRRLPIPEEIADLYRENISFLHLWENNNSLFHDLTGILSWKFSDKMLISLADVHKWINENPGYNVYIFNPFPYNLIEFNNLWVEAEACHPDILSLAENLFSILKWPVELLGRPIPFQYTCYCNYWVADRFFWAAYMQFLAKVLNILNSNPAFNQKVKRTTTYHEPTPFAPFLLERMFSIYLFLHRRKFKVLAYDSLSWRVAQYEQRLRWYRKQNELLHELNQSMRELLEKQKYSLSFALKSLLKVIVRKILGILNLEIRRQGKFGFSIHKQ